MFSGDILTLKALSSPLVHFRPPDPFWIEIETAGYFFANIWLKDGTYNPYAPGVYGFPDSFIHFREIYYVERSFHAHQGRYSVYQLTFYNTPSISRLPSIHFDVVLNGIVAMDLCSERFSIVVCAVDPTTRAISGERVLHEGESGNISCVSSGVPVPTISWTLSGHITPFEQSDQSTDVSVSGASGHLVSTLHLVNIQYPAHDGVYRCTGSNHPAARRTAIIRLHILGMP